MKRLCGASLILGRGSALSTSCSAITLSRVVRVPPVKNTAPLFLTTPNVIYTTRYAQAAAAAPKPAAPATPPKQTKKQPGAAQPKPATAKDATPPDALQRLNKVAVRKKKERTIYPPVIVNEETEEVRVGRAKKILGEYQPNDPVLGRSLAKLNDALELCSSLTTHKEKAALADHIIALLKATKDQNTGTVVGYTRSIKLLGRLGKLQEAFQIQDLMKSKNLMPNRVTAQELIRACGLNKAVPKAWEVFNSMKKPFQRRTGLTVGVLIEALGRNKQLDAAKELLDNIETKYRIRAERATFLRYLFQCIMAKDKARALAVHSEIKRHPVFQGKPSPALEKLEVLLKELQGGK